MITSCWIDPNGKLFPVNPHKHAEFAGEVLGIDYRKTGVNETILLLVDQGWLHIGLSPFVSYSRYADLPESQCAAIHALLAVMEHTIIAQNIESFIFA